jgi:hypothetical protein
MDHGDFPFETACFAALEIFQLSWSNNRAQARPKHWKRPLSLYFKAGTRLFQPHAYDANFPFPIRAGEKVFSLGCHARGVSMIQALLTFFDRPWAT